MGPYYCYKAVYEEAETRIYLFYTEIWDHYIRVSSPHTQIYGPEFTDWKREYATI